MMGETFIRDDDDDDSSPVTLTVSNAAGDGFKLTPHVGSVLVTRGRGWSIVATCEKPFYRLSFRAIDPCKEALIRERVAKTDHRLPAALAAEVRIVPNHLKAAGISPGLPAALDLPVTVKTSSSAIAVLPSPAKSTETEAKKAARSAETEAKKASRSTETEAKKAAKSTETEAAKPRKKQPPVTKKREIVVVVDNDDDDQPPPTPDIADPATKRLRPPPPAAAMARGKKKKQ